MAVPVCPECGATIQPTWDWCHACGFDPEGLRPAGWTPTGPGGPGSPDLGDLPRPPAPPPSSPSSSPSSPSSLLDAAAPSAPAATTARPSADDVPPSSLRPHDLLRPRAEAAADPLAPPITPPLTGPLQVPDDDDEHRPLTLDDLRRSTGSSDTAPAAPVGPSPTATPQPAPPAPATSDARVDAAPSAASSPAASDPTSGSPPARDRFAPVSDRSRPPRPSDLAAMATPVAERPPLFPAPPSSPLSPSSPFSPSSDEPALSAVPDLADAPPAAVEERQPPPPPGGTMDEQHPYLDLPYDDPSPAPGSEPEPEPTGRLRRRRAQDDRPNAATMAMAAGRIPSDGTDAATGTSTLPPPPGGAPAAGTEAPAAEPAASERPSAPADTSSLGPIVFGPSTSPVATITKPPKSKSSPLSVAAILMTIAIAVIVLWPTYKSLVESDSGPALPPPSAGVIGYAPASADGSRAPVDPRRTASWETSSPAGGEFEIDMPGVVVVRTPTIPLGNGDTAAGVVASSSSGRGGYVVAAVEPAAGKPFTTPQQAAESIVVGFNGTAGNDLEVGAATTMGGVPAVAVQGTVDGVPSKGAVAVVGDRAFIALSGNVTQADHDRFVTSFRPSAVAAAVAP